MWMRHGFSQRQDGSAGDAFLVQSGNSAFAVWKSTEPSLDNFAQGRSISHPGAMVFEAFVIRQLWHPHRAHQLGPLMVERGDEDIAAVSLEDAVRARQRMERTIARDRAEPLGPQRNQGNHHVVHVKVRVQDRRVDVLAYASALSMDQRK